MTTVPAKVGSPYVIGRTPKGLIKLSRMIGSYESYMVFGAAEAIAVSNALVDEAESPTP